MKIKTFLARSLTLAAGLCTASNIVNAFPAATFSDSWKDAAVYDAATSNYNAVTAGEFHVRISLGGIVGSNFGSNTLVMLNIGTNGTPQLIISNHLRDDPNYSSNATHATFPLGGTNGSVEVAWAGTNITITGSTKADLLGGEKLYTNSVSSNFFLDEIILTVTNSSGPVFAYTNKVVPVVANNTLTYAAHTNLNGTTTSLEAGSLNGAADFTPPKVAITSPAANAVFPSTAPIQPVVVTASDKYGLTNLTLTVNGGAPIAPQLNGALSSFVLDTNVNLTALGTNIIKVVAFNTLGNSNSVTRDLILVKTNSVVVAVYPAGAGTVKGIKKNEALNENFTYPVTATPASPAWIFSKWTNASGAVLSSAPVYNYVDTTNGTLAALFVPNPFYDTGLAGTYEGLFFDTSAKVGPTNSGYVTVTVAANGTYSGRLYLAESASPFPLYGQLAVTGLTATADSKVWVSELEELDVQLQIAATSDLQSPGAGVLGGTVTATNNGTTQLWSENLSGYLVQLNPDIVPGLYNVYLSPEANPATGPGGYSFASVTVRKTGDVGLVLNLADGTSPATSFATQMTLDNAIPVYASLYHGKGVIIGWLQFAVNGSEIVANSSPVTWDKEPVNDRFYTNGFWYTPSATGKLYEPLNIFTWMNGSFDVDQGYTSYNLANGVSDTNIVFNPVKDTLVDTNKPNKVAITLNSYTGGVSGAFTAADFNLQTNTVALPSFQGVIIDNEGWGFYSATNHETGPIVIKSN